MIYRISRRDPTIYLAMFLTANSTNIILALTYCLSYHRQCLQMQSRDLKDHICFHSILTSFFSENKHGCVNQKHLEVIVSPGEKFLFRSHIEMFARPATTSYRATQRPPAPLYIYHDNMIYDIYSCRVY